MLKEFYEKNPSKKLNGKRWNYRDNLSSLHSLQQSHHEGKINLYSPIKAFSEQWKHVVDRHKGCVTSHPIEGTRRRNDLPPVAVQWQQSYAASCQGKTDGTSTSSR